MADHEPFSKVVVITGCSSGIGLHTAVCLAAETGFKVIATMRNLQKMGDLEEAAGESMNKSLFIEELDISKEDSILAFVKATLEKEGRIDVLINIRGGYDGEDADPFPDERIWYCQTDPRSRPEDERAGILSYHKRLLYIGFRPVTSIEPGPVQSAIRTNSVKNNLSTVGWSVDDEDGFDGKTNTIRRTYLKGRAHSVHNIGTQTAAEVAEVIKKCIYEEKPSFRIQTSEAVVECAKRFLVDPSGDEANEEISRSIGMTE